MTEETLKGLAPEDPDFDDRELGESSEDELPDDDVETQEDELLLD